jgi:hypothetical protein
MDQAQLSRFVTSFALEPVLHVVRFQVLMATCMRMTAFWGIAPCSLVRINRCFRGAYRLNHWAALFIVLMMEAARMHHRHPEAVRTPETSVFFNETTWRLSQKAFNFFVACWNTKGAFLASHRAARATSWSRPTLESGQTDADRSTWIYDSR